MGSGHSRWPHSYQAFKIFKQSDSRRCLDERLSQLVLSQSQLACRRGLSGSPTHDSPFEAACTPLASQPPCNVPLFLPFRHFSPTPANPLRLVHAARPEDVALHLSHWASLPSAHSWPVRFPRCRATGGAGSAKAQREVVLRQ